MKYINSGIPANLSKQLIITDEKINFISNPS